MSPKNTICNIVPHACRTRTHCLNMISNENSIFNWKSSADLMLERIGKWSYGVGRRHSNV